MSIKEDFRKRSRGRFAPGLACLAFALPCGVFAEVETVPEQPTECDAVTLRITREFTEDCNWRIDWDVEVTGNEIVVRFTVEGDNACADVVYDETFEVEVGRLPGGENAYRVEWSDDERANEKGSFQVADAACTGPPGFLRGDANGDGTFDIADPIAALSWIFLGLELDCLEACDADASGELDITDPIYMLLNRFVGGRAPPAPFPECAPPPGGMRIGCEEPQCFGDDTPTRVWLGKPDGCVQCVPCEAPSIEELVASLAEEGIEVYSSQYGFVPVCLACEVCASGRFYQIEVSSTDAAALRERGWGPMDPLPILRD